MKVHVFGNQDVKEDRVAIEVAERLLEDFSNVEFTTVKPNEDLPFVNQENVIILDVVQGIKEPKLIKTEHLEKLKLPPRSSVHDFDLGFQLKYLKKLGKLNEVKIIGIPMSEKPLTDKDYKSIHSIVKKLVAQDIQGS